MASSDDCPWKEEVHKKLITIFEKKDLEALMRVLFYLDEEDKLYKDNSKIPPAWRTLKSALSSDVVFTKYAERLAEDTKRAENDAGFRPKIIANRQVISAVDEVVGLVNKAGGDVVMTALAKIWLSYDAINVLGRWWRGEITGVRCCKIIVDSTFSIGAGVAGGIGGAALGSFVGPLGTVAGGIIGGIISFQATNLLIDRLTQTLFGIPKDEALENAYNFIGVKMTASNNEINTSFRKLCLKHHPDKGGNSEDFHLVQINMGVIKLARGEVF